MKKIVPKILNQATAKDDFLEKKIREIVTERLEVKASEVTLEASFKEDLNADSLDRVELIMAFEEAFDIDIPDEAAEKIVTVGDAVKYIRANKN